MVTLNMALSTSPQSSSPPAIAANVPVQAPTPSLNPRHGPAVRFDPPEYYFTEKRNETLKDSQSSNSSSSSLSARRPSAPTAIPVTSKKPGSTPTTPLSARGDDKTSYFPLFEEHVRQTPSPKYKMSRRSINTTSPSSLYETQRSPLSPTHKTRPVASARSSQTTLPPHLHGLPKYHPAVMAWSSKGSSARSSASTTPTRQHSDARPTFHLFQQDHGSGRHTIGPRPISPRLQPLGSPTDAVTPLALEGDDYLSAGQHSTSQKKTTERETAELYLRREGMAK